MKKKQEKYFHYLKMFKSSYLHFRLKGAFRGTKLFEPHVDKCISTLEDFFGTEYFTVKILSIEERGNRSRPLECWLIYQMAQSKLNIGSFYLVMEIANVIDFYSKTNNGKQLLESKLKTKDGKINEPNFPDSFLELYTGLIFAKAGVEVDLNRSYLVEDKIKPLDVHVSFNSSEYLIECKRIGTDKYISTLYETFTGIIAMPRQWSESSKFVEKMPEITACGFLKIPDCLDKEKELNKIRVELIKELRAFLTRSDEVDTRENKILTFYDKSFYVEKYNKANYEAYPTLIGEYQIALFFKILPKIRGSQVEFRIQTEFSFKGLDWNKRIIKAIKSKTRQHSQASQLDKIILIEIESFHGLSFPITRKHLNLDRIMNSINSPKTVILIMKNSGMGRLSRDPILFSNEDGEKIKLIEKLNFECLFDFGIKYSLMSS